MLPESLLKHRIEGDNIVPLFLGANDHPWLRVLLEEVERYVGRPRRELRARLAEPLPCPSPPGKRAMATFVLDRLVGGGRPQHAVKPCVARAEVFAEAARSDGPRDATLETVAERLGVGKQELEQALFADLPDERLVTPLEESLSPVELALRANLALAQGLLFRASTLVVEVAGNARAIVRHARFRGLIVTLVARRGAVGPTPPVEGAGPLTSLPWVNESPRASCLAVDNLGVDRATIEVSGPMELFHHSLVYGRALGELLPHLAWCRRFRLIAVCIVGARSFHLKLGSGDPIMPTKEPRSYDSKVEESFARAFRRAAPDWDLLREPEPVDAGGTLVFPDFALVHRHQPSRRWLLEIVGFWTPDYLARKLAQYRAAGLPNLILCIDEERRCAEGDLPAGALVVRYRRRVNAEEVVRLVERSARCRAD
ncbi:MAG: DUF790 family protein [Pseudomonadota bacterium]